MSRAVAGALLAGALGLASAVPGRAGVLAELKSVKITVAAFRGTGFELELPIIDPFERLLQNPREGIELVRVENLACHSNGVDYLFRLPARFQGGLEPGAEAERNSKAASAPSASGLEPGAAPGQPQSLEIEFLESAGGFFTLLPADPLLMDRFLFLTRDPASYHSRKVRRVQRRPGTLTRTVQPDGEELLSLKLLPRAVPAASEPAPPAAEGESEGSAETASEPAPSGAEAIPAQQWRETVALVYRIRTKEGEREAVFLYKTLGGEGRLAAVLERLREEAGSGLLVLNRGDIFAAQGAAPAANAGPEGGRDGGPAGQGAARSSGTAEGFRFEAMGVAAAVPGSGELHRLQDLLDYLSASPRGVQFLSANLVYSTDTARTVLPPFRIFSVRGLRVGVLGLTRPHWRKYLGTGFARSLELGDPLAAARSVLPRLRPRADLVIALSNLSAEENAALRRSAPGIDLIVGDGFPFSADTRLDLVQAEDPERGPDDEALLTSRDSPAVLTRLELEHSPGEAGFYGLKVSERRVVLDESLPDREGYPKFDPESYGVAVDTGAPLLPAARYLYGMGSAAASAPAGSNLEPGFAWLDPRHFWNLAASLVAERHGAEAAFLPVFSLEQRTAGDYPESLVREWFRWEDRLVVFELPGGELAALVAEVRRQTPHGKEAAVARGLLPPGGLPMAVGGLGAGETIHGEPIDANSVYRIVATERLLAETGQYPAFARAARVTDLGPVRETALGELRRRAAEGWPVERYRELLAGKPVREVGLWKVNFRDVHLSLSNTKVVSDPGFADVSNARVQGFDEFLVGAAAKTDLEYYDERVKWTNAAAVEYSRSRLRPPGRREILNIPRNNVLARTVGTRRAGDFPWRPVAQSYGPSLGAQYEGHVERLPLQRRRHVVSVFPGVEFFGGTVLRSLELSGNLRRDFTPSVPVNQFGFRARALASRGFGTVRLEGESTANYFIRTQVDTSSDLLLEWGTNLKLHVPLWRSVSVSPFFDVYYFILKIRPLSGYSAITGISFNFSRLWKPQYESF